MSEPRKTIKRGLSPLAPESHTWRPLYYLDIYRLGLAVTLLILFISGALDELIKPELSEFFKTLGFIYLWFALISLLFTRARLLKFTIQLYLKIFIDIIFISLLTYITGGISNGFGILLIVTVASGSLIAQGIGAFLFAAIATLAVLLQETLSFLTDQFPLNYQGAGTLGATFFATAFLTFWLARRIRESEALAEQRGVDLANLAQLNDYIIRRMQSGIVVVDPDSRVRLMNESAWKMLGMPLNDLGSQLAELSKPLAAQLQDWRRDPTREPDIFRSDATGMDLLLRFNGVGTRAAAGVLIILEDSTEVARQAQQMKLVSLGRMAASIAHEIRNPLGAISHAGQLLAESPSLDAADLRLTTIIRDHCARVNKIIENVLKLSRPGHANPERLLLRPWLEKFSVSFFQDRHSLRDRVRVHVHPAKTTVLVDPTHLQQIMNNLLENAFKYGSPADTQGLVLVQGGIDEEQGGAYLDVIDQGPGIDPENVAQIFEPFYTTAASGTGLGLYIASELCTRNQARLSYISVPSGGSCFRITFSQTLSRL